MKVKANEITVIQPIYKYVCDCPGCTKETFDPGTWFKLKWTDYPSWDLEGTAYYNERYYCSKACLLKAMRVWGA